MKSFILLMFCACLLFSLDDVSAQAVELEQAVQVLPNYIAQTINVDSNELGNPTVIVDNQAQVPEENFFSNLMAWLSDNWLMFLFGFMGVLKIIVNLTPTERDNQVYAWIDNIINLIFPNRKKGGGTHPVT